ncbi:MAG: hypothetical protein M9921_08155 [Fimbriimonadaceae bacterium]|nr:hypothetical protein [Fimbriimonadaceae bacterium]
MFWTLVVMATLPFAWFVWPTPFTYLRVGTELHRVNRLTGVRERATDYGWDNDLRQAERSQREQIATARATADDEASRKAIAESLAAARDLPVQHSLGKGTSFSVQTTWVSGQMHVTFFVEPAPGGQSWSPSPVDRIIVDLVSKDGEETASITVMGSHLTPLPSESAGTLRYRGTQAVGISQRDYLEIQSVTVSVQPL